MCMCMCMRVWMYAENEQWREGREGFFWGGWGNVMLGYMGFSSRQRDGRADRRTDRRTGTERGVRGGKTGGEQEFKIDDMID